MHLYIQPWMAWTLLGVLVVLAYMVWRSRVLVWFHGRLVDFGFSWKEFWRDESYRRLIEVPRLIDYIAEVEAALLEAQRKRSPELLRKHLEESRARLASKGMALTPKPWVQG